MALDSIYTGGLAGQQIYNQRKALMDQQDLQEQQNELAKRAMVQQAIQQHMQNVEARAARDQANTARISAENLQKERLARQDQLDSEKMTFEKERLARQDQLDSGKLTRDLEDRQTAKSRQSLLDEQTLEAGKLAAEKAKAEIERQAKADKKRAEANSYRDLGEGLITPEQFAEQHPEIAKKFNFQKGSTPDTIIVNGKEIPRSAFTGLGERADAEANMLAGLGKEVIKNRGIIDTQESKNASKEKENEKKNKERIALEQEKSRLRNSVNLTKEKAKALEKERIAAEAAAASTYPSWVPFSSRNEKQARVEAIKSQQEKLARGLATMNELESQPPQGVPVAQAPQGAPVAQPKTDFASEEEALSAELPPGTIVTIGGRRARL